MSDWLIVDRSELAQLTAKLGNGSYYVYLLRKPDGERKFGGLGTPFYVGIGQGNRLFSHENEARKLTKSNAKLETIRSIWAMGGEVVRTLDSFHKTEPWNREEELINSIGLQSKNLGPLTNAQTYSPSHRINGVEHRKYARNYTESGDANILPLNFKLRHTRLMAGPVEPRTGNSVYGKIYAVLKENPGVTGEELIELLHKVDFRSSKSAYTQGGQVSSSWLVGYIDDGLSLSKCRHLQEYL